MEWHSQVWRSHSYLNVNILIPLIQQIEKEPKDLFAEQLAGRLGCWWSMIEMVVVGDG